MHINVAMKMEQARAQARILKALANPVRLMIVHALKGRERCVCQLQPLFDIDQSTLSRHLSTLKRVGVVAERREGVKIMHRLVTPCVLRAFDCAADVIRANQRKSRKA
jgi:DNA-binding transcriptional ArsR family regulator